MTKDDDKKESNSGTQITIAIIGLVGVLGAAVIAKVGTTPPIAPTPTPTPSINVLPSMTPTPAAILHASSPPVLQENHSHKGSSLNASSVRFNRDNTPVLLQCDSDCILKVDGRIAGVLKKGDSARRELSPGDHLVEASDQARTVKWLKSLTLHGPDQVIVTAELQNLLFDKEAGWLIGEWRFDKESKPTVVRYEDTQGVKSNDSGIHASGRINVLWVHRDNSQLVGTLVSQMTSCSKFSFASNACLGPCDSDFILSFDVVVTEISASSAKIKLRKVNDGITQASGIDTDWDSLANKYVQRELRLSRRDENELILQGFDPVRVNDLKYWDKHKACVINDLNLIGEHDQILQIDGLPLRKSQ